MAKRTFENHLDDTKTSCISWDHKEQINIDELAEALKAAGFKGHISQVETGNDQYAIVVTNDDCTSEEAQDWYERMSNDWIDVAEKWGDDPMGSWNGKNEQPD